MKKRLIWIAELFIWLLVLFVIAGSIMFAKYNHRKHFNTYQMFLPDVDGLIAGSPVRLLGIQVGYINQINIVGENVYVKFIITEKNMKIPQGSTATVEFTGLGGSKSLELYPPKTEKQFLSEKFITPMPPKRIHDSLGLLNDMFDKIIGITYTISNFMDQVGIIKYESEKVQNKGLAINQILTLSSKWIDEATEKCEKYKIKDKKDESGKNKSNK